MTSWSEAVSATARLWNTSGISEFLIEQEGDKLDPATPFAELLDRPQGFLMSQQILASLQSGFDLAEAHLQVASHFCIHDMSPQTLCSSSCASCAECTDTGCVPAFAACLKRQQVP